MRLLFQSVCVLCFYAFRFSLSSLSITSFIFASNPADTETLLSYQTYKLFLKYAQKKQKKQNKKTPTNSETADVALHIPTTS